MVKRMCVIPLINHQIYTLYRSFARPKLTLIIAPLHLSLLFLIWLDNLVMTEYMALPPPQGGV